MKDLHQMALLFDFYGPLLTERQQELIRAYYLEDLSLTEIATGAGVSRQAVHDLIKRSEGTLHEYEAKLHLVQEHLRRQQRLTLLEEVLRQGDCAGALAMVERLKAE